MLPSEIPVQIITTEQEMIALTFTVTSASKLLAMHLRALCSFPVPIAAQNCFQQPQEVCHESLQGGWVPSKEEALSREAIPGVPPVVGEGPFDVLLA